MVSSKHSQLTESQSILHTNRKPVWISKKTILPCTHQLTTMMYCPVEEPAIVTAWFILFSSNEFCSPLLDHSHWLTASYMQTHAAHFPYSTHRYSTQLKITNTVEKINTNPNKQCVFDMKHWCAYYPLWAQLSCKLVTDAAFGFLWGCSLIF